MKSEGWVAIYAAVVGTSAFFLNLKIWFDSDVKLKLDLMPNGMTIGGGPELDESNLIILYVINRGDAPTMVTHMVLFEITSWWQLFLFEVTSALRWWPWKVSPTKNYLISNPAVERVPT